MHDHEGPHRDRSTHSCVFVCEGEKDGECDRRRVTLDGRFFQKPYLQRVGVCTSCMLGHCGGGCHR